MCWYRKTLLRLTLIATLTLLCGVGALSARDADEEGEAISTVGVSVGSLFGVNADGTFEPNGLLEANTHIAITDSFALGIAILSSMPIQAQDDFIRADGVVLNLGIGAVFRNPINELLGFYGSFMVQVSLAPVTHQDLLLLIGGSGGLEVRIYDGTLLYAELGGHTEIPLASLDQSELFSDYSYGMAGFIKIGTRFEI